MTTRVESPERPAEPVRGSRSSRRGWIAGILVVALVLGCGYAAYWWTHPELLGSGVHVGAESPTTARTWHAAIVYPSTDGEAARTLTLRDVSAHFAENSAQALVSFSVCRFEPGDAPGMVYGELSEYCTEVRPIAGEDTPYRFGDGVNEMIVLSLTPTRPGTASVDEVRIDYATGQADLWRRGEQTLHPSVTVRAP